MLNRREVAMLESLIRRMTEKQRSGLEVWISTAWVPDGPLWETVKAAQEYVHWYEVPPGEPWGTPEDRRPHLKLVK